MSSLRTGNYVLTNLLVLVDSEVSAFSLATLVLHDNVFIRDVWDQWNPQVSQGSTLTPFSSHFSSWVISATQKAVTTMGTITDLLPVSRVIYPAAIWTSPGNVLEVTTLLSLVLLQSQKFTHPNTTCSCCVLAPWKVDCIRDFLVFPVPSPQ